MAIRNVETNQKRRVFNRCIVTTWLLAMLTLTPTGVWAQGADLTTLVLSGESAPDGNGTFQLFYAPLINQSGQVAFSSFLSNTVPPGANSAGLYLADEVSVTQLVRAGDPAPDGNGTFFGFTSGMNGKERFALNANGTVAFNGFLENTAVPLPNFDDTGLFLASASSGVTQLVRFGDPAPDGNGVFGAQDPEFGDTSLLPPGLDDAGDASFWGLLFQTSGGEGVDDEAVLRANSVGVTQLARSGSLIPGSTETLESIDMQIASNAAGDVALIGFAEFTFPPGPGLERIYVDDGATFTEFFRTGTAPPDGDGMIVSVDRIVLSETGEVVFEGQVQGTIDFLDSGPRLMLTDGTTLTEIVRQAELGPGETDLRFTNFFGVDANGQGQIVFAAALERLNATNRTTGIYLWEAGVLTRLVREGDPAPDGNGTIGDVGGPVFLNEGGAVAFYAALEGTASPPGDANGIFVVQSDGSIERIVRAGQALEGSIVTFTSLLGDLDVDDADLALAGVSALNDAGQVAFVAYLADTRSGVFVNENVPEPSFGLMTSTALLAIAGLARRRARVRRRSPGPVPCAPC